MRDVGASVTVQTLSLACTVTAPAMVRDGGARHQCERRNEQDRSHHRCLQESLPPRIASPTRTGRYAGVVEVPTYRTTPEMQHGLRAGRVMRFLRKQTAEDPT